MHGDFQLHDASASSSVCHIMAPQFSRHLAEKSERYSRCCVARSEFPKHQMLMNDGNMLNWTSYLSFVFLATFI